MPLNYEIASKILKKAAPFLGVALLFFVLGAYVFRPSSDIKAVIKAQNELIKVIRENEANYRKDLQVRFDSLANIRNKELQKVDSLKMLSIKQAELIKSNIENLSKYRNEVNKNFSTYSDSAFSAIISRIRPK